QNPDVRIAAGRTERHVGPLEARQRSGTPTTASYLRNRRSVVDIAERVVHCASTAMTAATSAPRGYCSVAPLALRNPKRSLTLRRGASLASRGPPSLQMRDDSSLAHTLDVMPRRTTRFQTIVAFVRTHLATPGVTVTESKMLRDAVSDEDPEVDVVIEGEFDGEHVVTSIEVIEHKRPA